MCARFTVLSETPIASAIAGCVMPLSRSNTICMRWRCSAASFQRSAVLSSRTSRLVHLTILPPKSDGHRESHRQRQASAPNYRKLLDSISSGSGISSPDYFGPFLSFVGDKLRVAGRGNPKRASSHLRKVLHELAIGESCIDLGIQPFNNGR